MKDKPAPVFSVGQRVRLILNDGNKTPYTGFVQRIIWHHKHGRYKYYLDENGKAVSKRYVAEDLTRFPVGDGPEP